MPIAHFSCAINYIIIITEKPVLGAPLRDDGTPLGQSPEFDLAAMREVHKLSRARQGVVFPSRGEDGETSSSGSDVG